MNLKEAKEAGLLVKVLKDLTDEQASFDRLTNYRVSFDDQLYVPREVFQAMLTAGLEYAKLRLKELGVE